MAAGNIEAIRDWVSRYFYKKSEVNALFIENDPSSLDVYPEIIQSSIDFDGNTPVTLEKGRTYLFCTISNSGSFTNANITTGSTVYPYIRSGCGFCAGIIKATDNSVTYNAQYPGSIRSVRIDPEQISEIDGSSSWSSAVASLSCDVDDVFLIMSDADSSTASEGSFSGADELGYLKTPVSSGIDTNRVSIVKATGTTITYSGGNFYYIKLSGYYSKQLF